MAVHDEIAELVHSNLTDVFDTAYGGAAEAYAQAKIHDMESMSEFGFAGWQRSRTYIERKAARGELDFKIENSKACLLHYGPYFVHFHRVGASKEESIRESTPTSASLKVPNLSFTGDTPDMFATWAASKEVPRAKDICEYVICIMASPRVGGLDAVYLAEPSEVDENGVPTEWRDYLKVWESNPSDVESIDREPAYDVEEGFEVEVDMKPEDTGLDSDDVELDDSDEDGDDDGPVSHGS